ncbi:MAG: hypothetical protein IJK39_06965 [Bacteroidales bacterium]|nr:hypothetical protein [Bacteroidales bacterium]
MMIILTLFFVYPLYPDEISIPGCAETEIIDCDFSEEQVEGEISLARKSAMPKRTLIDLKGKFKVSESGKKKTVWPGMSASEIPLPPTDILQSSCLLRL